MATKKRDSSLTPEEKKVVKALLARGERNQDIQALININRKSTINSGRITEIKQSDEITPASDEVVERFIARKKAFDPRTGLNAFDDERLVRAREAMIVAVQIFNSPTLIFKTEIFSILANIAWTYLLHEHYLRMGEKIADHEGKTWSLSYMLKKSDCPLSSGIKKNLEALKEIRDAAEHKILGKSDLKWLSLFQACCLNFDHKIRDLFGEALSLQGELSFALQFSKLNFSQITEIQKHDIPEHIDALDARLREGLTEDDFADIEYQFRVIYTLDGTTKSRSHFQFVQPGTTEANEIRNVLVKYRPADETHPHKPKSVCHEVSQRTKRSFTGYHHIQAWKIYKIRPNKGDPAPEKTKEEYCRYHLVHNDYTYSQSWIDFLVSEVSDEKKWQKIQNYRPQGHKRQS